MGRLACRYLLPALLLGAAFPVAAQGGGQEEQAPGARGPTPAPAPPSEAGQAPKPPVLKPPELLEFVEASYPPEAEKQGVGGRVELELLLGPDGGVAEASVAVAAGHGFDEAALAAGRQLRFKPATADGEPIAARIRFPYIFELRQRQPTLSLNDAPVAARLEGRVLDIESEEALVGARVFLEGSDGSEQREASSDAEGRFVFDTLPEGEYTVRITFDEREDINQTEELRAGEATEVVYRMDELPDPDAFTVTARVAAPPREVTRRSIEKTQLTRIAGTRGDALRTVELLPGVARPPLGAGAFIIRGSAPADSQTLFEGLPVPLIYHFGGLTSFINSRMLDSVEFYPGNFSAAFGRRRGGIVDVRARDPARDRFHGVVDINLIDASFLLEAPITDNWEFAAAARRSYIDLVFEGVLPEDEVATLAAPIYYDYQFFTTYRPTDDDKLRLMVFGSSDELKLLFTKPTDTLAGDLDLRTQFHRVQATWSRAISEAVDMDVNVSAGPLYLRLGVGQGLGFELKGTEIYGRAEWRGRVTDEVRLIGGLDLYVIPGTLEYSGPPPQGSVNNPDASGPNPPSNQQRLTTSSEFTVAQPAIYLETDINLYPVRFVLGTRLDYYGQVDAFSFDPRLVGHYYLNERLSVKAGVGWYSQPPAFQEADPVLGNPNLTPTHTLHLGVGSEYQITDTIFLGVDGFYKHLYDVVVGTENGQAPFFSNEGLGRVYGLEVSARIEPTGRLFGYLSYTLSRSERQVRDGAWAVFEFDQPHIFTASAVYRIGRGWEAGATFRLVSGNPSTDIIDGSFNSDSAQESPIYGMFNAVRQPMFNRLDVRIEKLWTFDVWKLALYLDIQNIYNAQNPEGYIYDFQFATRQAIRSLPIIPNLGIRGEM